MPPGDVAKLRDAVTTADRELSEARFHVWRAQERRDDAVKALDRALLGSNPGAAAAGMRAGWSQPFSM